MIWSCADAALRRGAPGRGRLRVLALCALLTASAGSYAAAADLLDDSFLRGSLSGGPVRWDGVVMGGQVGYSSMQSNFGNSTSTQIAYILRNSTLENEAAPQNWTTLPNKLTNARSFGGFIGYNMQWDDLVLGGDIGYNRMSKAENISADSINRIVATSDGVSHNVTIQASSSIKLIDYATFRGRAGYAFGQFLPYAIFGGAVGRFNYSTRSTVTDVQTAPGPVVSTFGPVTQTDSQDNKFGYGWVWGLGMDVAITPNVFLRGEWEYISFNKISGILNTVNSGRVGLGVRF
jgi:outer membrane immunogenic protein